MSHSYKSEYPAGVEIDAGIKTFFEEFYKLSDKPEAIEEYANKFTQDATVIMGIKKIVGRPGMWHTYKYVLELRQMHSQAI